MGKKHKHTSQSSAQGDHETIQNRARELHMQLFPEEFDFMSDSSSDANRRERGDNPMSTEHIDKTNSRRAKLGFEPFRVDSKGLNDDTFGWVLEKLRSGFEDDLRGIKMHRDQEDMAAAASLEAERLDSQIPEWQDTQIDEMLASDAYVNHTDDRKSPEVVAFRILGEIFKMCPSCSSEEPFRSQISRVLPGKTTAEYEKLYRHALNEWTSVYTE